MKLINTIFYTGDIRNIKSTYVKGLIELKIKTKIFQKIHSNN